MNHIKGNSLILVALPMTGTVFGSRVISMLLIAIIDDIDNQKALALAREADPAGKRTIGITSLFFHPEPSTLVTAP